MAAALEPIVDGPELPSQTSIVAVPDGYPSTGARKRGTRASRTVAPGPRQASPAPRRRSAERRPFTLPRTLLAGGPNAVLAALAVVGVLGGALLLAAMPGDGATVPTDPARVTDVAQVDPTIEPDPDPTAEPTQEPTPEPPSPTPAPAEEEPTAVPAGDVADLCEIFFDLPCGLGPGRYAPSRFAPAFDIELGDGWSTAAHTADTVALRRDEGVMTFAGRIVEVYPEDGPREPRERARDLIEAFITTEGVSATRPASVRIDGRRGLSSDLTPIDSARIQLFATDGTTYFLEPDRTTRVVVMDLRRATLLLAIEPHEGFELAEILETADDAAGTLNWR